MRVRVILTACSLGWAAAVAFGVAMLWRHDAAPGAAGAPPARWPAASRVPRGAGRYDVVVFAHPRCPCTRATIGELARVMARCGPGAATAHVLFVRPAGVRDDGDGGGGGGGGGGGRAWEQTDLWRAAAAIPGVVVLTDPAGAEAARFGSVTSGQVLAYDPGGALVFAGGITASRGHAGDNAGSDTLAAALAGGVPARRRTPVYGCLLFDPNGPVPTGPAACEDRRPGEGADPACHQ